MNIIEKLSLAADAVKAGQSLKDSTKWKNVQLVMPPILVVLTIVVQFSNIPVTESELNAISYGIATFGVLLNTYLTAATTTKKLL